MIIYLLFGLILPQFLSYSVLPRVCFSHFRNILLPLPLPLPFLLIRFFVFSFSLHSSISCLVFIPLRLLIWLLFLRSIWCPDVYSCEIMWDNELRRRSEWLLYIYIYICHLLQYLKSFTLAVTINSDCFPKQH
jgi:hypothetical protein